LTEVTASFIIAARLLGLAHFSFGSKLMYVNCWINEAFAGNETGGNHHLAVLDFERSAGIYIDK